MKTQVESLELRVESGTVEALSDKLKAVSEGTGAERQKLKAVSGTPKARKAARARGERGAVRLLLQRKPRCDSKLDGLSPERQEELVDWLGVENVGLAEAVARVRERWGVVVGLSAMQAYRRREVELRRYAEEAEAAAEWTAGAPARFAEAVVRRAQQMAFAALTDAVPDVAEAERLGRLAARLQRVELARERVAQAERRLAWAERGWAREAEVQDAADEVRMKEVEEQIAQKEAEWAQERAAQEAELDAEWEELEREQKALSDKLKAVSEGGRAESEELRAESRKGEGLKAEGEREREALREQFRVKQEEKVLEQETSREGTEGKEERKAEEALSGKLKAVSGGGGAEEALSDKLKAVSDGRGAESEELRAEGRSVEAVSGKLKAVSVRCGTESDVGQAVGGGAGAEGRAVEGASVVETEEEANARRDRVCDEIARRRALREAAEASSGVRGWDEAEEVGSMW